VGAAWVVGILAVVGLGFLGAESPGRGVSSAARASAVTSSTPAVKNVAAEQALWVDRPARRDDVVATPEVIVQGRVSSSVDEVWVALESTGGKPLAMRTLDATGHMQDGTVAFESRIPLSMPRPAGSLILMVVAVGTDGVPIEAIRRRFQLGAITDLGGRAGR
jgi:hypothetical protein